jgi:hypothetical protein
MIEQKNVSFTINENDPSKNVFEIKIIVDDNRVLNNRDILTYNINKKLNLFTYEEKICLFKCFSVIFFIIIFVITVEIVNKK